MLPGSVLNLHPLGCFSVRDWGGHRHPILVPGGGVEPPRPEGRRILSTQKSSEPFGKFSTPLDSSTAYNSAKLSCCDPICTVLSLELLQFYYSVPSGKAGLVALQPRRSRDETSTWATAPAEPLFLIGIVPPNVSGCEQTLKSVPDRILAVPLRMLQVPRPELNRCIVREYSAQDRQQNQILSETSDRR